MVRRTSRIFVPFLGYLLTLTLAGCGYTSNLPESGVNSATSATTDIAPKGAIQHVVVIFQENVSFDHYFGTYPRALNLPGESPFKALPGTPEVDGLSPDLLKNNPNATNPGNGAGATNPIPVISRRGHHIRSGSQLQVRTAGFSRRSHGSVPTFCGRRRRTWLW
jgi:phospholipase C